MRPWTLGALVLLAGAVVAAAIWLAFQNRDTTRGVEQARSGARDDEISSRQVRQAVQTHLKFDRTDKALELLHKHLAVKPGDVDSRVLLGELLIKTGQIPRAEEISRKLLSEHPENPKVLWLMGMVRASRGHEDANVWFARAVARPGVPADLVGSYARALIASGRMEEARRWLLKAYRLGDRNPRNLMVLGKLALEQENFPAARTYLDQAVEEAPEDFEAHVLLIEALKALGLHERRKQVILRSLELAPSRPVKSRLYMSLGALQELQQRYQAAAESYRRAASWKPVRGNSLVQAAWNHFQAGQFAKAMGAIDQAREILGPTEELRRLNRQIELARFGPPEEAKGSGWFEDPPVLPEDNPQEAGQDADGGKEASPLFPDPGIGQSGQP